MINDLMNICDHCEENEATVICPECGSQWCKKCVSPKECLACGAKLEF